MTLKKYTAPDCGCEPKLKKGGKNWIQGAIKKPGSFTAYCKRQGYSKVTNDCIAQAKKSNDPTTVRRANLAKTLRKMQTGGSLPKLKLLPKK